MAGPVSVKVHDAEFTSTLRQYMRLSKRDPKTICDTKAFWIARHAILETPKADKNKIKSDLGKIVRHRKNQDAFSLSLRTVKRFSRWGLEQAAPLAALIIQSRRKRAGKPSLFKNVPRATGAELMRSAVKNMIAARLRSIGYMKSGWIPAIRRLFPYAEKAKMLPRSRAGEVIGREKGSAIPASEGWRANTRIENRASSTRDRKDAMQLFGEPALRRAFDRERQSMLQYMHDKLRRTAHKAGIKTN